MTNTTTAVDSISFLVCPEHQALALNVLKSVYLKAGKIPPAPATDSKGRLYLQIDPPLVKWFVTDFLNAGGKFAAPGRECAAIKTSAPEAPEAPTTEKPPSTTVPSPATETEAKPTTTPDDSSTTEAGGTKRDKPREYADPCREHVRRALGILLKGKATLASPPRPSEDLVWRQAAVELEKLAIQINSRLPGTIRLPEKKSTGLSWLHVIDYVDYRKAFFDLFVQLVNWCTGYEGFDTTEAGLQWILETRTRALIPGIEVIGAPELIPRFTRTTRAKRLTIVDCTVKTGGSFWEGVLNAFTAPLVLGAWIGGKWGGTATNSAETLIAELEALSERMREGKMGFVDRQLARLQLAALAGAVTEFHLGEFFEQMVLSLVSLLCRALLGDREAIGEILGSFAAAKLAVKWGKKYGTFPEWLRKLWRGRPTGRLPTEFPRYKGRFRRVYLRKGVKAEIEAESRLPNGGFENPRSLGSEIDGPWDYGHRPEFKYHEWAEVAQELGVTWEEFKDIMNDPKKYWIEPRGANRSGVYDRPALAEKVAREQLGEYVKKKG